MHMNRIRITICYHNPVLTLGDPTSKKVRTGKSSRKAVSLPRHCVWVGKWMGGELERGRTHAQHFMTMKVKLTICLWLFPHRSHVSPLSSVMPAFVFNTAHHMNQKKSFSRNFPNFLRLLGRLHHSPSPTG